jgi:predicted nucleic acid-binding protein
MRLIIDTNRYSDMDAGDPEVSSRFEKAEELWLPFVVVGELRAGFLGGNRLDDNLLALERFLSRPNTAILLPDIDTMVFYAAIFHILKKQGELIPTNDIWIAAQALQQDLTLDSRDAHFRRVPGLKLIE